MKRDYRLFLKDMLDAMESIESFVGDMDNTEISTKTINTTMGNGGSKILPIPTFM